jgi:hypothetical protein
MSSRTLAAGPAASASAASRAGAAPAAPGPTITPDLAAVLHDARPHPQLALGAGSAAPPATGARLARAAAAIAADLALRPDTDPDLAGLHASYLLPAGTRARVHRAAPGGVLLLAPCDAPRAVAAAGPGIYVVVEASP